MDSKKVDTKLRRDETELRTRELEKLSKSLGSIMKSIDILSKSSVNSVSELEKLEYLCMTSRVLRYAMISSRIGVRHINTDVRIIHKRVQKLRKLISLLISVKHEEISTSIMDANIFK